MDVGEHPTLPLIAFQSQPESLLHLFLLPVHGPHLPPFFLFSQPQPRVLLRRGGAGIHAAGVRHPTRKRAVRLEAAEARDAGDGGEEEGELHAALGRNSG